MSSPEQEYFNRQILEGQAKLARSHSELAKGYGQISNHISEEAQKKIANSIKDILIRSQEKSRSYTQLIITAGYAGFFATWKSVKPDLPEVTILLSGLFMIVSVLFFISSEIHIMIQGSVYFRKSIAMVANGTIDLKAYQRFEYDFEEKVFKVWIWMLIPTILFGLSGALLLILSFVLSLLLELRIVVIH